MRRFSLAALGLAATTGCTTTLSTIQTADTVPKGHVAATGAIDVSLPVTRFADALSTAYDLEQKVEDDPNYQLTDEDKQDLFEAAVGLALSPPGANPEGMLRYGLAPRFDAGLRLSPTGVHGDVKYQFLGADDGSTFAGSISVGYRYHFFSGLLFDALELVKIDDFSRHDLEIPLILGTRLGEFGRVWFGPKLVLARVHVDATLQRADDTLDETTWMTYYGGFAGFSFGYKWVQAFLELTIVNMDAKPVIFGRERDIGGIVIAPAAGLMIRI